MAAATVEFHRNTLLREIAHPIFLANYPQAKKFGNVVQPRFPTNQLHNVQRRYMQRTGAANPESVAFASSVSDVGHRDCGLIAP